jgi:hypothetical protein
MPSLILPKERNGSNGSHRFGRSCEEDIRASCRNENLRRKTGQLMAEFDALLPYRGKGNVLAHVEGESLLHRMAKFIPRVLD